MAHTYGTTYETSIAGNDPTYSYFTVPADTTALVVTLFINSPTGSPRTGGAPTFNGTTLTDSGAGFASNDECAVEVWWMADPPTGSVGTLSCPNTGLVRMSAIASTFKAQAGYTSDVDVWNSAEDQTTANPSTSVTTNVNGDAIISALASGYRNVATPAETLMAEADDGNQVWGVQYFLQSSLGTKAMAWTQTAEDWSHIVLALKEVAGEAQTFYRTLTTKIVSSPLAKRLQQLYRAIAHAISVVVIASGSTLMEYTRSVLVDVSIASSASILRSLIRAVASAVAVVLDAGRSRELLRSVASKVSVALAGARSATYSRLVAVSVGFSSALSGALTFARTILMGPSAGALTVSDDFNRTDENPIGSPWDAVFSYDEMKLSGNQLMSRTNSTDTGSVHTGLSLTDGFVQAKIAQVGSASHRIYFRASITEGYMVDNDNYGTQKWRFYYWASGNYAIGADFADTPAANDVYKVEFYGDTTVTVDLYKNDSKIKTWTDSDYTPASGYSGLGTYYTDCYWDDFSTGELGGSPGAAITFALSRAITRVRSIVASMVPLVVASMTKLGAAARSVAIAIGLSTAPSRIRQLLRILDTNIQGSGSVTRLRSLLRAVGTSLPPVIDVSRLKSLLRSAATTIDLSALAGRLRELLRSLRTAVVSTVTVSRTGQHLRRVAHATGIAAVLGRTSAFARSVASAIGSAHTVAFIRSLFVRTLSATVPIDVTAGRFAQYARSISSAVTVSVVAGMSLFSTFTRSAQVALLVSAVVARRSDYLRGITVDIGTAITISRMMELLRSISTSVAAEVNVARLFWLIRSAVMVIEPVVAVSRSVTGFIYRTASTAIETGFSVSRLIANYFRTLGDQVAIGVVVSYSTLSIYARSVATTVAVTIALIRIRLLHRAVAVAVALYSAVRRSTWYRRGLLLSATMSHSLSRSVDYIRSVVSTLRTSTLVGQVRDLGEAAFIFVTTSVEEVVKFSTVSVHRAMYFVSSAIKNIFKT